MRVANVVPYPEGGLGSSDEGERARRFDLHLRLRYRRAGEKEWHHGRMENISRSGVLFRTHYILAVDTPVLMSFVLPGRADAPAIVCRGRVVRTVLPGRSEPSPGMATTISGYRFLRGLKTA